VEGSRRILLATGVAAVVAAGAVAGCGGGERQDKNEPSGTFKVDATASFPTQQRLAGSAVMRVVVHNADTRTIPDVAVTISSDDAQGGGGFTTRSESPGLSDPTRQLWIVDQGPRGGDTAYVSTWALGALGPGRTRRFVWHVTPVRAGTHTVRWRVAAGLNGKARAQTTGGEEASGTIAVNVSRRPAEVTVDPKTGNVVDSTS
jgi:hypothetical protein